MHINQQATNHTLSVHVRHKPFGSLSGFSLNCINVPSACDVPRVYQLFFFFGLFSGKAVHCLQSELRVSQEKDLLSLSEQSVFLLGTKFAYITWSCSKLLNGPINVRHGS